MVGFDERSVRFENIPAWYDAQRVQEDFKKASLSEPLHVKICQEPTGNSRTWGVVVFNLPNEARWFLERIAMAPNMLVWSDTGEPAVVKVDVFLTERPRA